MENQSQTDIRYDVYIDGIKDEASKKQIIMFLAGIIKHIQLEDIISGLSNLPFKVVSSVTEQTAMKLQERLGVRDATVRLVQLVPGTFTPGNGQNISTTSIKQDAGQDVLQTPSAPAQAFDANQISAPSGVQTITPGTPAKAASIKRLWTNWVEVMFNAPSFFKSIDAEKQVPFPVIFGIVWGTVALLLNLPAVLATQQSYIRFFSGNMPAPMVIPFSTYLSVLVMSPFFLFIFLFVLAGIYHLFVLLVGGKGGFISTLKVISYSTGAMVFEVIPYIGVPLFWFYSLYLYTIGFRELHKISTSRSFIAAILPLVFVFFFIMMLLVLVVVGFGFNFLRQFRPQIPGIPI